MALSVIVNVTGSTQSDIESALEEALRSIRSGNTSGFDKNDSGSFNFDVEGEEDPVVED